ncbi:hypothetical protein HHO41_09245 [Bacillus sp. DNRA2]|uniref:hypothetical protein n=1 Tax=Bacillus sp. DNRA2 TaxID=2723053 RepID=UPI00145D4B99|nr:hypothetical protein [Bacillus sp. DNRA2]NMD70476.1 hypothetical protein [Bacillus sp. DNRA2]
MTFQEKLSNYISTQIYVATSDDNYTGILQNVTDNLIIVQTIFPGYGDITDHVIRIDQIAYVRLIP